MKITILKAVIVLEAVLLFWILSLIVNIDMFEQVFIDTAQSIKVSSCQVWVQPVNLDHVEWVDCD